MASPEAEAIRRGFGDKLAGLSLPLERLRSDWEADARSQPLPPGVVVEPVEVGGRHPTWVSADGTPPTAPVLLWAHGGGFNSGSPLTTRSFAAHLALATGWRVFVSDYRLAPEHPCPAAIEDVAADARWLMDRAPQVAIGGDSSGGGLALAALCDLRQAGLPMPRAAVLVSPWLDLTLTSASLVERDAVDPMVSQAALAQAAAWYLADLPADDPRASPLFADLHELPPLLVLVGSDEVLFGDASHFALRARAAGVNVDLDVAAGMWHVYPAWAPALPEANQALERIAAFLGAEA